MMLLAVSVTTHVNDFCGASSFKYGSDDDNSSVTSGSGYGAIQSSPHSASQNASQSLPVTTQAILEPLCEDMSRLKESNQRAEDSLTRLMDEFESYKVGSVGWGIGAV